MEELTHPHVYSHGFVFQRASAAPQRSWSAERTEEKIHSGIHPRQISVNEQHRLKHLLLIQPVCLSNVSNYEQMAAVADQVHHHFSKKVI